MMDQVLSNQDVSAALELLDSTLSEEGRRISKAGESAMNKQDWRTARAVLDFANKLEIFRSDVQGLVKKWNNLLQIRETAAPAVQEIVTGEGRLFSSISRKTATGFTREVNHPIAHKSIFSVTFSDGTTIAESKAWETLLKAIAKIGVEEVLQLGLSLGGEPLVGKSKSERFPSASKRLGEYYIFTHSNTKDKTKILERIMELLSIKAKIRIYEAPDRKA